MQVLGKEKISSILRRASRDLALVPEDWTLHRGLRRLEEDRTIDHYKQTGPISMLHLEHKSKENIIVHKTQTPSPQSKHEPSSDSNLIGLVDSPNTSTNVSGLTRLLTPPTPLTNVSPSMESLDAKTSALKKLNDTSKELEIATIRKRDVMLFVVEAKDRVQRATDELSLAELDDWQATKRIAEAEDAMRSAWKDMDTALGIKAL